MRRRHIRILTTVVTFSGYVGDKIEVPCIKIGRELTEGTEVRFIEVTNKGETGNDIRAIITEVKDGYYYLNVINRRRGKFIKVGNSAKREKQGA